MKFGWLTLALSPSPDEDATRIDQQIEQVRAAEALGFSDVWLTEHYFTGESVYNDALTFAAAIAMGRCRSPGVAMSTISISGLSMTSRQSQEDFCQPSWARAATCW